jgi:hypothetical protein
MAVRFPWFSYYITVLTLNSHVPQDVMNFEDLWVRLLPPELETDH